jgi:hypothetical protein
VIKSIEPYSFTKGTFREEVCSRLIKPTTQVYLGNVGLLTRPLTCDTIVQTRVQREGRPNIVQGPEAIEPYSSTKGTFREEVCSWYQSLLANALRSCFSSSFGCSTARVSYAHTAHTGSALRKLHKSFPYSLLSFSTIIKHLIFTKNPTLQQPEPEKSTHELLCLHPKLYLPVSTAKNDAQTNSSPSSTNVSSFSS